MKVRDSYNYNTADGKITSSSAPRPNNFTWGKVLRVHVVGDDYAIVEYRPRMGKDFADSRQFAVYVRGTGARGWDTGHSFTSLDRALIAAIAWRADARLHGVNHAANSRAVDYVSKMLELDRAEETRCN